jgi:hypothetical protein
VSFVVPFFLPPFFLPVSVLQRSTFVPPYLPSAFKTTATVFSTVSP